MVSIGIFTLITTISVFSYSDFNSNVLLTNLAYEIALSVRQAQFYGITVKQSATAGNFDSGYGVHLTQNATSYTLFEDGKGSFSLNHVYEVNPGDITNNEGIETYSIQKGNFISRLCTKGSGSLDCTLTSLDLSFVRPNPDTFVAFSTGVGSAALDLSKTTSVICVASPKGTVRKVTVESTGQISVSTSAPECLN